MPPPGEPGAFERDPRKALRAAMHAVVTQLSALGAEGVSIWVPNSFDLQELILNFVFVKPLRCTCVCF